MNLADRIRRGRQAIALAKRQGLDTTQWEQRLLRLLGEAGKQPALEGGFQPWVLWEWRRLNIPQWRDALDESIAQGDLRREEYARWMLRDILLDPQYEDEQR